MKYTHESLNFVLLGRTGVGKSSSGNTILGREAFKSKKSSKSLTKDVAVESVTVGHLLVNVYDTPGLFDTDTNEEETQQKLEKVLKRCESRPCVFLLVIKADRFTEEERKTVEKIEELLGQKRLKKTWIIFTGGDQLDEENMMIEEFIIETEPLKNLIQQYNQRYHVFNNKTKGHSGQVKELLTKIPKLYFDTLETLKPNPGKTCVGKSAFFPVSPVMSVNDLQQKNGTMIDQNGGRHYNNQMIEDVHRFRREEEEERQSGEEPRKQEEKQRQDEIERERSETKARYKAKIEAQQKETSDAFLCKHHIYIAAIAVGFLIGGAVGGAVVYGVVGGAVGGAVGGTAIGAIGGAVVGGAVTGAISGAAICAAVGGAVVGALGGAAVGAAVGAAIVGGASAASVGVVVKAFGVAVVGGAAVGGAVGGASKKTIKGAVEGAVVGGAAISGAAVSGAAVSAALSGAVGGYAIFGAVACGAAVGAAFCGATSKNGVGALFGGAVAGGAVIFGATVGGAIVKVVAVVTHFGGTGGVAVGGVAVGGVAVGGVAVGGVAVGRVAVGGVTAGRNTAGSKLFSGAAVDARAVKNCTC